MKPKHKPCINCGASEYKPTPDGFKCEYCGTEYESEISKQHERVFIEHELIPLDRSQPLESVRYEMGVRLIDGKPKGFFNEVGDAMNFAGGMFDCVKTILCR